MIKSLALTNFKSIGKTLLVENDEIVEGKLDFRSLTVFCGKNSSGKSTILQSVLLLAQTMQNNVPSQTLVLNGSMIKLGDINDIKSQFSKSTDISIDIGFEIRESHTSLYDNRVIEFIDEYINIDGYGDVKYSLSNSLDMIKEAIINRTGLSVDLDSAKWTVNRGLSKKVINLMNQHQVKYSMTDYLDKEIRHIVINKHDGDEWHIANYFEIGEYILTKEEINEFISSKKLPSEKKEKIVKAACLNISFFSKGKNCISNILPIINRIHIHNSNAENKTVFTASRINKPKNIAIKDNDFDCFNFVLDKSTNILVNNKLIKYKSLFGLKLNHFFPSEFVYLIKYYKFMINAFLSLGFNEFISDDYQFNDQSVFEFNSYLQEFLINKNENIKTKKLNPLQFIIPQNVAINDKPTFVKHVNLSIAKLKKRKKILSDNLLLQLNILNKTPVLETDEQIFPYKTETSELGISVQKHVEMLTNYLKNKIIYIGPLREEPHLQYNSLIGNIATIGTKGENCAAVLFHGKDNKVRCINPASFSESKLGVKHCCLKEAVNNWLCYIGVAQEVNASYRGRYGYELKVKSKNNQEINNDMTNVGVGLSQVLPIVLTCLRASEGSTIIIEQPELHLHPAMQTKLVDLFIATMLCNKQVIIETHSEHIINGFRLRTVNCPTEKRINDNLKIYFSETLPEDNGEFKRGNTVFKPIEINECAAISDWPDGFFDEAQLVREEIIEAVGKKLEMDNPDE